MTVRSTQLAAYTSTGAFTGTVYTCPAGWRTIVKSVQVFNGAAASQLVELWLYRFANNEQLKLYSKSIPAGTIDQWNGWSVMNPTDVIQVNVAAANIAFWASGTLLQLTGQEPV